MLKGDRSVKGRRKTLINVDEEALKGDVELLKGNGEPLKGDKEA